jgi:hypothetical protein
MESDVTPDELADTLFALFLIRHEHTLFEELRIRCDSSPTFRPDAFESQIFAYLAASIALALTYEYVRQPKTAEVISSLKSLVHGEVVRRGQSMDEVDDSIEEAAQRLTRLIDADPEVDTGYSFNWAQEWLKRCGVEEYNPAVLFHFSLKWKMQNLALAKSVSGARIA